MTTILSIQSSVAYGHVGNSAAAFTLMRMGVEVYPVLTVHFSNSTGYGSWRGPVLQADQVAEVVKGVDERGALADVDAVLSGYQGSVEMGQVILDAVALVRERNPRALYCADPVMGDVGKGFYVAEGIPAFLRDRVVPAADVITPNQFELEWLSGRRTPALADVLDAADAVRATGPSTVLVTSAVVTDTPDDTVSMIAVTGDGAWMVTTPMLPPVFDGSGDITAASFLARLLATGSVETALGDSAAIVFSVLSVTADSGRRELQLVRAQSQMVDPDHRFEVTRLR